MSLSSEEAWRLVELERAQIGHDLHDDLVPLLFAARAGAEAVLGSLTSGSSQTHRPQEAETLSKVVSWLESALVTSRDVIAQLQPLELHQRPWAEAAKYRLEYLSSHPATLAWTIQPEAQQLDEPFATTLFRLTVEAVRNAVAHGKASNVEVSCTVSNGQLCLKVEDNGNGFDPSAVPSDHFGIEIMKHRAALVGGTVEIHSQPNHPTTVIAELPLPSSLGTN